MLYPTDGPPKYIQKPRFWAGVMGFMCVALHLFLNDPIWFESLQDQYGFAYPWITNGILITIYGTWLIAYEWPRIWKKELFHNEICWRCGHCVKGISDDTCPECGYDEVARGIQASRRTHGFLWLVGPACKYIQRRRFSQASARKPSESSNPSG